MSQIGYIQYYAYAYGYLQIFNSCLFYLHSLPGPELREMSSNLKQCFHPEFYRKRPNISRRWGENKKVFPGRENIFEPFGRPSLAPLQNAFAFSVRYPFSVLSPQRTNDSK